jgi:hypothetical protein
MKSLISVLLVALFAASVPAQPVPAQNAAQDRTPASLQGSSLIDALLEVASRFQLPLAVEWVKSPETLRAVRFSENFTTATEAFGGVLSSYAGYAWRLENGVVHVFPKTMVNDPRNPLNFVVDQIPNRLWTVKEADDFVFQSIGEAVRSTGPKVLSADLPAGSDPRFGLRADNAPVREVLNQIISASKMKIWIATFPRDLPLTVKGFWETTPMYDPRGVKPEDQPFWIFLRWGDSPWKRLVNSEP